MAYNIIQKNGSLKFDKFFDLMSKPHNGYIYGLSRVEENDNGVKITAFKAEDISMDGETIKSDNASYVIIPNNVTYYTSSELPDGYAYFICSQKKGNKCHYIAIKGKAGIYTNSIGGGASLGYRQLFLYTDVEVLGVGTATFTNSVFDFCNSADDPDDIKDRFIKVKAGQSGDERKVYNYFDLQNGKFVLPDKFVYSIKYNNGKFIVNTSKSSFPEYYDLDGNKMKLDDVKDKIIIEASDRYRRVRIGKKNPIDAFVVKHRFYDGIFALYKDYDYDKDEFTNEICQFTNALHVIDIDRSEKDGKTFYINNYEHGEIPYNDIYGKQSETFSSRLVDKVITNNEGDILLYTTPSKEIKYVDLNDMEEHTIYTAGDNEKLKIEAYSIYDYKRHNIIIQISYKQYGNATKYVDLEGNIKAEFLWPTDAICYEEDWRKNGFFKGRVYNDKGKEETKFFTYNEKNGEIEEVDMNGVRIGEISVHNKILYVQDYETDYMHQYNTELKCVDDDNIIMQKFYNPQSSSYYAYVVYHKDTKLYDVMPTVYDKRGANTSFSGQKYPWDFFAMELNGEPYRPKSITVVGSKGNGDYAAHSMLAIIAERYVDGALKKTLFISDGQFPKDEEDMSKGRKWFTVGEYDDIVVTDYWRNEEGYFGMTDTKKDFEANRIYVTDGNKETTYGVTYAADGHLRLVKKRS